MDRLPNVKSPEELKALGIDTQQLIDFAHRHNLGVPKGGNDYHIYRELKAGLAIREMHKKKFTWADMKAQSDRLRKQPRRENDEWEIPQQGKS